VGLWVTDNSSRRSVRDYFGGGHWSFGHQVSTGDCKLILLVLSKKKGHGVVPLPRSSIPGNDADDEAG